MLLVFKAYSILVQHKLGLLHVSSLRSPVHNHLHDFPFQLYRALLLLLLYYYYLCELNDLFPVCFLREWFIAHDQWPFKVFSLLLRSTTFLKVLAVPNNIVFWSNKIVILKFNFPRHLTKFFVTFHNHSTTICTNCTVLIFHILAISLLFNFLFYFSPILYPLVRQYQ